MFKTSRDRDKDVLFIYDNIQSKWDEYEISPTTVEQEALWKNQNIDSEIGNWKTTSKITKIDKFGVITVHYRYAKKNRTLLSSQGECLISYRIDSETGRPEMTRVSPL